MQVKPGTTVASLGEGGGEGGDKKVRLVPSKLLLPHEKI